MIFTIKIVQVLRVEKSTRIVVDAGSVDEAIEAIGSSEIDLSSASDDVGNVWTVESTSLEYEAYFPT